MRFLHNGARSLSDAVVPFTIAAILVAVGVNVLWGGTYVAVKLGLGGFPPLWSAFFRFALGLLCVVAWAKFMRLPLWPARSDWWPLSVLSAVFALQIVLMNFALTQTGAGVTSVLISTHPLFAALLAHVAVRGEALSWRKSVGLLIAFAGTACVLLGGDATDASASTWVGNALALLSGVVLGARFVVQAEVLREREPALVITWLMLLALPAFLFGALALETLEPARITASAVAGILYQGVVVAGIGFMTVAYLLKRFAATTTVSFGFINPVSGVALGALLLDEPVTSALLVGIGGVAIGLIMITRSDRT